MVIRPALPTDDADLLRIDERSWSWVVGPQRPRNDSFFASTAPDDVLVADLDGTTAGYVMLGRRTALPSNRHVHQIQGLAVDPEFRRRGVGQRLIAEAIEEARRRGGEKLGLRVFEPNAAACALYLQAGFEVVGALRDEFRIEGRSVDDLLMEIRL